ncbi:MAG: response regulator [Lachnospiraceae bacterium]|nr:response regulator [Lachnospiraceae bacterium]
MKTVLIAEDEKLIRKGLETMVRRAPVPVEEILSVKDGEEALEVLRHREVDVLITDIRMPRMDGIALTGEAANLPNPPLVLVVSGYDDFNYAVSMLRQGVHDYLLKPVERQRLYQALEKLEEKLKEQHEEEQASSRQYLHAIRLIMLEQEEGGEEYQSLVERYEADFVKDEYVAYCARAIGEEDTDGISPRELPEGVLRFPVTGDLFVYVSPIEQCKCMEELLPIPAGRSRQYRGLAQLRAGYREAFAGWQRSFFSGDLEQEECGSRTPLTISGRQLLGMVSLSWDKEVSKLLSGQAELVAKGEGDPEEFARICSELIRELCSTYENLIEPDDDPVRFAQLWNFRDIELYLEELEAWLGRFCVQLAVKFADYENKQKIRQAVQYIQAHFTEQLNMAVVSNEVSMNYSLFSLLFKQYTGANFVSYLQELRIKETCRLLETTDWRVNEIGRKAGFSDEKHFLKVFKAATGFSPTEYRKANALIERKEEQ